MLPII